MVYKYRHPEYFDGIELPDFRQHSGNIVLFGAGGNGAIALALLEKMNVEVICFCDNNEKKWGTEYFGYLVISPNEMKEKYPEASVIVTPNIFHTIYEQLKGIGYAKVYDCAALFLEFDTAIVVDYMPDYFKGDVNRFNMSMDIYLRKTSNYHRGENLSRGLTVCVTERCTLRCLNCLSFMPYYKNPVDCDWNKMDIALDRLLGTGKYGFVFIEGGEILLYNNLHKLINKLTGHPNVESVAPTTNGTLLFNDETLHSLKHEKIYVRLDDYDNLSTKTEELKKLLEKNNVKHAVMLEKWCLCAEVKEHNRTEQENQEVFENCCKCQVSPYLLHGKLYACPYMAHTYNLGVLPIVEDDYIDLLEEPYEEISFTKKINDYFNRKHYFDACKYCNGRSYKTEEVPIAEQVVGELPQLVKIVK